MDAMYLDRSAHAARIGNKLINIILSILMIILLLYGGFSLYSNYQINHNALGGNYLKYKPQNNAEGLAALMKKNKDVRAWLTIDHTHIDYPVVQGHYDYEYLNKDVFGDYTLSGSIFMSTTNNPHFQDPYTLIYGHHMEAGAMFGDIDKFLDRSFFEKNTKGKLYTLDHVYKITIFACVSCDAYDSHFYSQEAQVTKNLPALEHYIQSKSVNYRAMNLKNGDHIIGLSTCADTKTNGRYILFGKLD
ncbi:class B sortase [Sharpea azabuensis]|uniref:class B sortase n=1 Tax=Sharpea azabuensis TaxID=322505 RepID=UPI0013DC55F5|nr:class B sortase [Sharpea azabuensis]